MPPERATAIRFFRFSCRKLKTWVPAFAGTTDCRFFRACLALAGFLELAIAHQPLEALLDELFRLLFAQLLQRLGEGLAQRLGGGLRIAVRAAERLGDDL